MKSSVQTKWNRDRRARARLATGRQLRFEVLEARCLLAVSNALLNSWFLAGQGENAQAISGYNVAAGPSTTWPTNVPVGVTYSGGNTTPTLGDVLKVSYSTNYVYINTADFASYVMGPWFNPNGQVFMNFPANQNALFRIREGAYPSTTHALTTGGAIGIAANGVAIYNNGDAFSYSNSLGRDAAMAAGDRLWNRQGQFAEAATFDHANAHQPGNGQYHYHVNPTALRAQLNDNIDYVGTTNFFPRDPEAFLDHGQGPDKTYVEHTTDLHHSPILGWTFDGHPLYGPYGYSNPADANSPIERVRSSFRGRSITERISLPGWAAQISFSANVSPDSVYPLATNQYGPSVSATNPIGRYGEDFEFVPGLGGLDQYNGRFTVTPEFPGGVYAYFVTIEANGTPAFPYILGRQYYGTVNSGRVTTTAGDGAVTVLFDIATNTAPVVSGPNAASVANNAVFNFTAGNKISVFDVDAATTESVTVSASAGTLNVNLSGALASGATISSGANNSPTMTLSGHISQLNAALATLAFTAPSTGTTATLTVQGNDGSTLNNLSNTLTTTIIFIAPVTPSVVNRQVFYNRSLSTVFGDGIGNPVNSIDSTKSLLLPGQLASFANYSNYSKGLNGLIIDVADFVSIPTAADFQFATWDGINTLGFEATTAIPTLTVLPGVGPSGSNRIKIEFADNAIRNTWLRVTILANANTGLLTNDVSYFGNAVGDMDAGNVGSPTTIRTNATDTSIVRQNQSISANSVGVTSIHDINKDGRVNASDTSIVRQNQLSSIIRFFTAPASFQLAMAPTVLNQNVASLPLLETAASTIAGISPSVVTPSSRLKPEEQARLTNAVPSSSLTTLQPILATRDWIVPDTSSVPSPKKSISSQLAKSVDDVFASKCLY